MKKGNPFLPVYRGDIAIIDGRSSKEAERSLNKWGFTVIRTIKCETVDDSIAYHPDIVMHPVNDRDIVVAPEVYEYYRDKLEHLSFNLIMGEKSLEMDYPRNIWYNVGRVANLAIHKTAYTDPKLRQCLDREGVEWLDVKQGYAKCSVLTVGENVIITSDRGIERGLAERCDMEVCLIEPGNIRLEGMEYGFIGGAGGMMSYGELVLSGHYRDHPNKERMDIFLDDHGVKVHKATEKSIEDWGSVIFLDSKKNREE